MKVINKKNFLLNYLNFPLEFPMKPDVFPPKKLVLGLDLGLEPDPGSEFNSIHFAMDINKSLKFLRPKSFWVYKFLTILKLLKKIS